MTPAALPLAAEVIAVVFIGLALGSLASLLVHRLPRGLPVGRTRSRCPRCGARLGARDLVPLVSWLAARGRCRHCGGAIGWRYPAIEASTALAVLAGWAVTGVGAQAACLAVLATALIAAAAVDLEWRILPDSALLAAGAAGLGWRALAGGTWAGTVLGAALLAALALGLRAWFTRRRGVEALGLGDVKLMAVAGLWLPPAALPAFLVLAGTAGTLLGLAWQRHHGAHQFPFGPALAFGLYATVLAHTAAPGVVGV